MEVYLEVKIVLVEGGGCIDYSIEFVRITKLEGCVSLLFLAIFLFSLWFQAIRLYGWWLDLEGGVEGSAYLLGLCSMAG